MARVDATAGAPAHRMNPNFTVEPVTGRAERLQPAGGLKGWAAGEGRQ
jgi:hypothetical protein